jgi:hypothetical protein
MSTGRLPQSPHASNGVKPPMSAANTRSDLRRGDVAERHRGFVVLKVKLHFDDTRSRRSPCSTETIVALGLGSTLEAEELGSVADKIHNGNLRGLTILTTMTICDGGRRRLVMDVYIGNYAAALVT